MTFHVRPLLLGIALSGFGQVAWGLGFGPLPTAATLGQTLDLRIPLRLEAGEDVPPECVTAEVRFGDVLQQRGTTSAMLEPSLPGARDRTVRVLTTTRIDEPVIAVEVSAGCAARVTRRFTLFADPPLYTPPTTTLAAVVPIEPGAAAPATEPAAPAAAELAPPSSSAVASAAAARPVKKRRPRPSAVATARAPVAAAPAPRAPLTAPAMPSGAAVSSQLKLATLEQGANLSAAAASAAAQDIAAAEAAASAASAVAAAASARAAEAEASGARTRAELDKAQQTINELKARLQQTEAPRSDSAMVYGLGGLTLLLLGLLIWMWRQREQEREASAWLEQAAASSPRPGTPEGDAATAEALAFAPTPSAPVPLSRPMGFDDTQAASRTGLASRPGGLGPVSAPAPLMAERREVSVEELIDLEQQAEFFIVLGQDEAAIDLLMGHLRSTSDTSPLPYLKLLEICKRRGDRKEYERLRDRFNSRFAARAPEWETDLQGGLALEDYPAVVGRLQSLWSQPKRAMEVLQATLLREPSDADLQADSFDLPAYRELMMLYSVARDLSESDASDGAGTVDLLLPLEDVGTTAAPAVFERLIATTSLEAQASAFKPLEIDLPLDDAPPADPSARR